MSAGRRKHAERVSKTRRLRDRGRVKPKPVLNLHQTPLNSEKYASWYRFCAAATASGAPYPGSGQKPAGMHGNGFRQTSSPASSGAAAEPVDVKASTAIPSKRHWISPRKTGSAVHIPAKSEHMSVPPVCVRVRVRVRDEMSGSRTVAQNRRRRERTGYRRQEDVRANVFVHEVEQVRCER